MRISFQLYRANRLRIFEENFEIFKKLLINFIPKLFCIKLANGADLKRILYLRMRFGCECCIEKTLRIPHKWMCSDAVFKTLSAQGSNNNNLPYITVK